MRKHAVGRRLVARYASLSADRMACGATPEDTVKAANARLRENEATMGIIATILLGALINQIVALVAEWIKRRAEEQR